MRVLAAAVVALVLSGSITAQPAVTPDARLRDLIDTARIGASMRRLSARPHHVGSPYDKDNADWLLAQFTAWGWDARVETYDVLFPTPVERRLDMVAPHAFTATLDEPAVAVDPTSGQKAEQLPPYNAYSVDGDVTGPLVYVNYGRPADYEQLDARGISVRGAIVIARYGGSWRGIKPKVAAEHGAVGCLIYSDPRDDGYFVGDVFPAGPMRNANGVQRGSVMDMPTYPGDPLTPGIAATPDAQRLDVHAAPTLTTIPVLPISYGDAQPLLAAMTGETAPADWRGALPITYHLGPGPARVHLKVRFAWDLKRLYNVIAELRGAVFPDEWVIRGNHHDAWVNGAADPVSGLAPELEEARVLGELARQGWRPKRTIIYAAWDGEEPGLLGSTEWVEQHGADLAAHAVAYINSDGNGRGFLGAGGSHTLEALVNEVARDVPDPETNVSVWERKHASLLLGAPAPQRTELRTRRDWRLSALGSGSDYTPFLQHAGVASLSLGFGGFDPGGGVYHSIYDDYFHFTSFLDKDFAYGGALAQVAGTAVIRLADADLLPFDFAALADTVQTYVGELQALLKDRQAEVTERNRLIRDGVYTETEDPRHPITPPAIEPVPPALNFAPLENAARALTQAADRYAAAARGVSASALTAAPATVRAVNARLRQSERQLTDADGLPRRPWYRHLLYAPGFYTGYDVKTMPGVREGIEQRQYPEAEAQAARVAAALMREVDLVAAAAADLERLAAPAPR
jgi:N-acetylated-alpha-linked acidic dipeptidase